MLFNNVAMPFVVCVTCRGMFEEELLKNTDDDSASGSVDTTSTNSVWQEKIEKFS